MESIRERMSIEGKVTAAGEFEVLAMTAGEGNGWQFAADVLQESLALWNETECFIDHSWWARSIKDLAGVFYDAQWDESAQGVKLKASGPAGPLLTELGKEVIQEDGPKPKIGFSADVMFTAKGKEVNKILRVFSVDLVYNPARGGAFLRALNSEAGKSLTTDAHRWTQMEKNKTQNETGKEYDGMTRENEGKGASLAPQQAAQQAPAQEAQLEEDRQAVRLLLDEQKRQHEMAAEAEKARQVRAEMCGYLLESALGASKLPPAMQKHVKAQFAGQVFEPAALQAAIEDARGLVSELTGGVVVSGPGRVSGMFNTADQLQVIREQLKQDIG